MGVIVSLHVPCTRIKNALASLSTNNLLPRLIVSDLNKIRQGPQVPLYRCRHDTRQPTGLCLRRIHRDEGMAEMQRIVPRVHSETAC